MRLSFMRKIGMMLAALMLTLTLGACGNKEDDNNSQAGNEQPEEHIFTIEQEEMIENDDLVATVNGEDIYGSLYNVVYTQTKIQLSDLGQDVDDLDFVKEVALDAIVDQELIRQNAEEVGISVSEEEVDQEFNELKEMNEEQVTNYLEKYHLEEDAFKSQISHALYHEKYVDSEISVSVSDEELEEVYEELKENNDELPEFGEIEDQLRSEMTAHRAQEKLMDIVTELKEEATIEMKI